MEKQKKIKLEDPEGAHITLSEGATALSTFNLSLSSWDSVAFAASGAGRPYEADFPRPMPDEKALAYFIRKQTTATAEKAAEIAANWSSQAKTQAFFSSRVAGADILEGIRHRITQVLEGKGTQGQARDWIRSFLKTDGANALKELGFASDYDARESGSLSELASFRRLNLIIETNVRTAQAVGEYQSQLEDSDIFPYVEYMNRDGGARPSHRLLNGTVVKVGSPEHAALTPPRDYNCRCYWRQLAEDELGSRKVQKGVPADYRRAREKENSSFDFNPAHGLFDKAPEPKPQWGDDLKKAYRQDDKGREAAK